MDDAQLMLGASHRSHYQPAHLTYIYGLRNTEACPQV
jgi:hypothetical protein